MMHHGLVTEQSRKYKAAKSVYDNLRNKHKGNMVQSEIDWPEHAVKGREGISVPPQERFRILNLRFQDEHLSPYFKTDLNLFQLMMFDESTTVTVYKTDLGILFAFEDAVAGPKPFGQLGFDTR